MSDPVTANLHRELHDALAMVAILRRERDEARETNRRINRRYQQLVHEHSRTIGQTIWEDGERIRQFWAETQRERNESCAELSELRRQVMHVANGCHDYGGGYGPGAESEAFHHGIQTVVNALEALMARGLDDTQVAALAAMGEQP